MAVRKEPKFPWYQIVTGADITQGDIILQCLVPVSTLDKTFLERFKKLVGQQKGNKEEDLEAKTGFYVGDVIVMTQACDIEYNKVESIILCPIKGLEKSSKDDGLFRGSDMREKLVNGDLPPYHLLNKDAEFSVDYQIVNFHHVYSIPRSFLELVAEDAGERLRLLPPYREHLSQAFARYFMRMGLPVDIGKLPNYKKEKSGQAAD